MKIIRILILLIGFNSIAQNGFFTNISGARNLKIHLSKSQTHALVWHADGGGYGLVYDLQTGEQVKELILKGFTSDSRFKPHIFDYRNDNVILAGWDENNLQPEHYFIWDEASNTFYTGKDLPSQHGIIHDIIGDEIVFSFTIYKKDSKGRLNLKKPLHSFVQFYNWKTKKWREFKQTLKLKENLPCRSLLLFEDGNKMKYFDLKTTTFLTQTTPVFDNIVTNYQDGNVYASKYKPNHGIDKVALFDLNALTIGSFNKAPTNNNMEYYWGEMMNYQVKLEQNNKEINLVITNKQSKDTKKVQITTSDKAEIEIINEKIDALKEMRLNKTKDDLDKKYAGQKAEFVEFKANFEALPKTFIYDYNKAKGRDITNLKMSKRLFLTPKTTVYAIGKLFECEESNVFLVMLRGPQAEGTESVYAVLKTDHYGNRLQYQIIARTIKNQMGYIQMDQFSIATYLNSNTTVSVTENYMGEEKKREFKFYCLN